MKDEVYVVATRHAVPVVLVANARMFVPEGMGVELVVVEQGADRADDWIAENVRGGDVVVTADIPLAARCLEAGAQVLGHTGQPITEDSVGGALAMRELKQNLRESGVLTGGPPPLSEKDRSRFLASLDQLVQRGLREHAGGA